jgi:hypothetical protein
VGTFRALRVGYGMAVALVFGLACRRSSVRFPQSPDHSALSDWPTLEAIQPGHDEERNGAPGRP